MPLEALHVPAVPTPVTRATPEPAVRLAWLGLSLARSGSHVEGCQARADAEQERHAVGVISSAAIAVHSIHGRSAAA